MTKPSILAGRVVPVDIKRITLIMLQNFFLKCSLDELFVGSERSFAEERNGFNSTPVEPKPRDWRLLVAIVIAMIAFAALFAIALQFNVPRDFAAVFAAPVLALVPLLHRPRRGVDAFFLGVASLGF